MTRGKNKNMQKRIFFMYTSYIWTKTLLGLTFHPLRAIKETIRRPILIPVIFSPFIGVVILFISAKIGGYLLNIYGISRDLVAIFLATTALSILFWQLLLFYLLGSFIVAKLRR